MPTGLSSALQRFPRHPLLDGPTPIQRLAGLEAVLGAASNGVRLYVKRDDHMSLGGGGNKLRKLEFLLGEARAQGADTVVTVGGLQSNHARLTAAAAARAGMACELVLGRVVPRDDVDYEENGNMLLNRLFGATVHALPVGADAMAAALERVRALELAGRRVYLAPLGGSTPVGALGYAACALEILAQSRELGVDFARIVVANGSAGTHAGLAAGVVAAGLPASRVQSFTTLADAEVAHAKTVDLTAATLALLAQGQADDVAAPAPNDILVDGSQRGLAYGVPTPAMLEAVGLLARSEGLLLDPVYSGKAFAGLLADVRAGRHAPGSDVLFVMTGGAPGLYAYKSAFQ
ncbi:D-cysteine desulfhydrase family protein [Achromobacter ruhlandii]|uniref:D-cysteine desulfhydrase family protein n=1 Tax=Achromobacter ruhlandii TaxID=72557 RepID=UPI003B9CE506